MVDMQLVEMSSTIELKHAKCGYCAVGGTALISDHMPELKLRSARIPEKGEGNQTVWMNPEWEFSLSFSRSSHFPHLSETV